MAEKDRFELVSPYKPTGDQPQAIEKLVAGSAGRGQGTDAAGCNRLGQDLHHGQCHCQGEPVPPWCWPTTRRWRPSSAASSGSFSPNNAVEYFVSYYDYYQPEAYIPATDTYIEKDSAINDEIDKLRHSATSALSERRDVIIVASVSCIYTLGDPIDYRNMVISLRTGMDHGPGRAARKAGGACSTSATTSTLSATSSGCGGTWWRFSRAYAATTPSGWNFSGTRSTGSARSTPSPVRSRAVHQPCGHLSGLPLYRTPRTRWRTAIEDIEQEMDERVKYFKEQGKLIEAQRIAQRTNYDIEMLHGDRLLQGH